MDKLLGTVTLDYKAGAPKKLIENLSGCALIGPYLWTVSDEGRTLERLTREGDGFVLAERIAVDDIVEGIPGAADGHELDLESIDIADGYLWLCGSHCWVRSKPARSGVLNDDIGPRPSRNLLARVRLKDEGARLGKAQRLPFKGKGSLRKHLVDNDYLKPFIELPSKENGLDIEGFLIHRGAALLGLRGPVIDGFAVVVALTLDKHFEIDGERLHFLDLGGLGVRDLARHGDAVIVLAGPTGDTHGPFRLFRWNPRKTALIQEPVELRHWSLPQEKPEAICPIPFRTAEGLLCLYDSPDAGRIDRGRFFQADVFDVLCGSIRQ
jgi:Protein of unknown function (DUF3616)